MYNNVALCKKVLPKIQRHSKKIGLDLQECAPGLWYTWAERNRSLSCMGTDGACAQWRMSSSWSKVSTHSLVCETRNPKKQDKAEELSLSAKPTYSFHTPFPHYLCLLRSDHKSCLGLPSSKSIQCLLGSRSFWRENLKPLGQQHLEAAGAALAVSWHVPSSRADRECWRQKNNGPPGETQDHTTHG